MTKQKPTKISFFGHFGSMNSGNEATLLAIVSRLRLLFPNCEFCCICTFPENVVATHGIDAVPHTVRSVRIWDRQVPLGKRLRMAFLGLGEEFREYIRAWRALKGTDMFIIPGTGLLTDAFGLSGWGPYGLLKWSLMARLRGCRVMFVSVGAGPVRGRLGTIPREVARFRSRTTGRIGTSRARRSWKASAFARGTTESTRISFLACRPVCYRRRRIARDDPSSVSA